MKGHGLFLALGLLTAVVVPLATGFTTEDLSGFISPDEARQYQAMAPSDIVLTRIVHAPIEKVWDAWTKPEEFTKWWGAKNFTSPSATIDFRVGGNYVFHMRAPKDQGSMDFYNTGEYKRIEPFHLIEVTQSLSDSTGRKIDPTQVGMPPDFPAEITITLTFTKKGKDTELTVTETGWTMGPMRSISETGLNELLDKLEASLR